MTKAMIPLAVAGLAACAAPPGTEAALDGEPIDPVGGYRGPDDTCGESTRGPYLFDVPAGADLVSCPTGSADDASFAARSDTSVLRETPSLTYYAVTRV